MSDGLRNDICVLHRKRINQVFPAGTQCSIDNVRTLHRCCLYIIQCMPAGSAKIVGNNIVALKCIFFTKSYQLRGLFCVKIICISYTHNDNLSMRFNAVFPRIMDNSV